MPQRHTYLDLKELKGFFITPTRDDEYAGNGSRLPMPWVTRVAVDFQIMPKMSQLCASTPLSEFLLSMRRPLMLTLSPRGVRGGHLIALREEISLSCPCITPCCCSTGSSILPTSFDSFTESRVDVQCKIVQHYFPHTHIVSQKYQLSLPLLLACSSLHATTTQSSSPSPLLWQLCPPSKAR